MDWPEFEVNEDGTFFTVLIFEDYVIKVPRRKKSAKSPPGFTRKDIDRMVEIQNEIAEKVDGVPPCRQVGVCVVMPRVKGVRCDEIEDQQLIKRKRDEVLSQISGMGYQLRDCGKNNMIYCPDEDQMYMVDFHIIKGGKK